MNSSISERIVFYRINHKNYQANFIGEYIKKERIKQGLKQELVCKGICSVSYYSRIENNKVNPSETYINKIFKKLNKPVPKCFKNEYDDESNKISKQFLDALEFRNQVQIEKVFGEVLNNDNLNKKLYEFIYKVYHKELFDIDKLLKYLYAEQNFMTNEELLLFLEYLGLYCIIKRDYIMASKYLKCAITLQNHMRIERPSLFYRYAYALSRLNQLHLSIVYSWKASEIYQRNHNLYYYVCTRALMAEGLAKFLPERSISIFHECLQISNCTNLQELEYRIKLLLAQTYKRLNNYEQSEKILKELSLQLFEDNSFNFDIHLELIDLYLKLNDYETARYYYDYIMKKDWQHPYRDFYLKYYHYSFNKPQSTNEIIKFYYTTIIPFFQNSFNKEMLVKSYLELATIYENNGYYQESLEQYKKAWEYLNRDRNINIV